MPSVEHEAPLEVLREAPALVAELLRELLGFELPAFAAAEVADGDFSQALPAEWRADLVVRLVGPEPEARPVLGVVVEVQRTRDDDERRSWPLYVATLHARLACQTCLLVLTLDDAVARWAARPITSLQLGSAFAPLVLGPSRMPRLSVERARAEPWLALLSVLAHGNRADGADTVRAVAAAFEVLPREPAVRCYDVIYAALNEAARRLMEDEMQSGRYEYKSDFARRYFGEGRELGQREGREQGRLDALRELVLSFVDRHGPLGDGLRERVTACTDPERLRVLAVDLAGAADAATVASLLATLPAVTSPPG